MKLSTDRILTTHVGSLPRPKPLIDLILGRERGEAVDATAFEAASAKAVEEVVAKQVECGVDVVSDGECGKAISFAVPAGPPRRVRAPPVQCGEEPFHPRRRPHALSRVLCRA